MADLIQTPALVLAGDGAKTRLVVAGATITAGKVVYKDVADGNKHKPLDASSVDKLPAGIALNGAANNQPLTIQYEGDINIGAAGLVFGELYCASALVPGNIAPYADAAQTGNYVATVGMARDTEIIAINLFGLGVAYDL